MKPSDLKQLISERFKAGIKRSILIESEPGLGKTQITRQVALELKVGFKMIHAPLLQPEDYGFPVVSREKLDVSFVVSKDKFPVEGSDCPETGIFLIDELSQADNSTQKILANLVQEREIHGIRIKPGWLIVATGNRVQDRAGANRILTHLKNRVTSIALEFSLDDLVAWAFAAKVKPEVISFWRWRPELVSKFDPNQEINPTPRSWVEGVGASLGVVSPLLEFESFKGDVGEGPAAEFSSFLKIHRELPSVDRILADPKKAPIPKEGSARYAACGALIAVTTKKNIDLVVEYVTRLEPELQVLYMRDLAKKDQSLQETKAYIKWATTQGVKILS